MAFSYFLKKASSMFGLNIGATKAEHIDGEIIYCKNNVCVHPPASLANGNEHNPGYLTVRAQKDEVTYFTTVYNWHYTTNFCSYMSRLKFENEL